MCEDRTMKTNVPLKSVKIKYACYIRGHVYKSMIHYSFMLVRYIAEVVCCHDAQDISGTQIVLLWKCEVPPVTYKLYDPATCSEFCTSCIAPNGVIIP
jgi:hypothetical protein